MLGGGNCLFTTSHSNKLKSPWMEEYMMNLAENVDGQTTDEY